MLIVDDSKAMRTFLAMLGREMSFAIVEAANGCEALNLLALSRLGDPFDVALVDWEMPRMNGLEFVRTVRRNHAFARLKLLMITRQNSLERVAEALAAGADDFLMKPVTKEMLADKLQILGVADLSAPGDWRAWAQNPSPDG
jgi:two-component system chemotaxis response regulator CheY